MSVRTVHLSPEVTRPIAMPPIISLIGTPASMSARVDPHVDAIEDEPFDSSVSLTTRIVYGNSSFDRELADVFGATSVRTEVLLGDGFAELVLEKLLVDGTDLLECQRRVLAGRELRDRLELELVEPGFALRLVGVAELGAEALAQE